MTQIAELNRSAYLKSLSDVLSLRPEFNPLTGPEAAKVRRVEGAGPDLWEPSKPTTFFPKCHANIIDGEVKSILLNTRGENRDEQGIFIEGNERRANIYVTQHIVKDAEVATSVVIKDQVSQRHGLLELTHAVGKEDGEGIDVKNFATYYLTAYEREKIVEQRISGGLTAKSGSSWNIEWNFDDKEWNIVDGKNFITTLNKDFIEALQVYGFNIPSEIDVTNAGGIRTQVNVSGKKVNIVIPSDLPKTDVMAAFVEGLPVVPLSIQVDGEERIVHTSREQIDRWHKQFNTMRVSQTNLYKLEGNNTEGYQIPSALFNDARIVTKKAGDVVEEPSSIIYAHQELVDNRTGTQRVTEIGVNAVQSYSASGRGEFHSDVTVESEKGFRMVLRSAIDQSDETFRHVLRMRFSKDQVAHLASQRTSLSNFFVKYNEQSSLLALDWDHVKERFMLKKYTNFAYETVSEEIECPEAVLEGVFGFSIPSSSLRLDGPVAMLHVKTGIRDFSITVPALQGEIDVNANLLAGKPMLPICIYTNAQGGWRDIMKSN